MMNGRSAQEEVPYDEAHVACAQEEVFYVEAVTDCTKEEVLYIGADIDFFYKYRFTNKKLVVKFQFDYI